MTSLSFFDMTMLSMASLLLGIILLVRGGNWTIDAAVFVARRYGVSPMVVGFTIVAFGTSLPELIVSVFANLQGSPGIAIGNVLGSNIANILMVLGASALFATLKASLSKELFRDLSFMVVVTLILAGLLNYGEVSRLSGFLMVLALVAYVFYQYKSSKPEEFETQDDPEPVFDSDALAYLTLFVGLITIAVGAEFLVRGATVSAELVGVPDSVIALSIIAFGTSLPELATSIVAARKGQSELVIGNIVGSNVFNVLMIIGVSAMVKPIIQGGFSPQLASFDVWVTLGVSLTLVGVLSIFGRIGFIMGGLFSLSYIGYNILIFAMNMES